ncbi:MAG: LamG domain-containing protein [Deltaproteobacteria bacterium]|nr:LamG domain-containing protein [Deltaproteobacteria bacterium]
MLRETPARFPPPAPARPRRPRTGRGGWGWGLGLSLVLLLAVAVLAVALLGAALPARAQHLAGGGPREGWYQAQDGRLACYLGRLPEGSWQLLCRQSGEPPAAGFAFLARLLPASPDRLAGGVTSLPGSCCPFRGRLELGGLGGAGFRFLSFAPEQGSPPWPLGPGAEFRFAEAGEAAAAGPAARWAGAWSWRWGFSSLLAPGRPADLAEGRLELSPGPGGLAGKMADLPGRAELAAQGEALTLTYHDPQAGFTLRADLRPLAGGLALSGPFASTLGPGHLVLVRQGLPAWPPGLAPADGQGLDGAWVDTRTGNDFYEIKSLPQGFSFTAFGGERGRPRYLSQGKAEPQGGGLYLAQAQDQPGQCCGNQGRLSFKVLGPDRLEVRSRWWPLAAADPGGELGPPFVLMRKAAGGGTAPGEAGQAWPQREPARRGLPPAGEGAVAVEFAGLPGPEQTEADLFSQGGYPRELAMFLTAAGEPGVRLTWAAGRAEVRGQPVAQPREWHRLLASYRAGGELILYLDGREVGRTSLAAPWGGSDAPYFLGGSRWPGRDFPGRLRKLELWPEALDPAAAGAPPAPEVSLDLNPGAGAADAAAEARPAATPEPAPAAQRPLVRYWHPSRLVHAYESRAEQAGHLEKEGFQRQGPLGLLAGAPGPGLTALAAFRHPDGHYSLGAEGATPPGSRDMGRLGYYHQGPAEGLVPLLGLAGRLDDPLGRGGQDDIFYTCRADQAARAGADGYGEPAKLGYLPPLAEPDFVPPLTYTWSGSWQGEGWGHFHLIRQGRTVFMFWTYAGEHSPRYYGRYELAAGGRTASGLAWGPPGPTATYFRQTLEMVRDHASGPLIRLTAQRLAAPLDDGKLVKFRQAAQTVTLLYKKDQGNPPEASKELAALAAGTPPARLYQQALERARNQGRLLER